MARRRMLSWLFFSAVGALGGAACAGRTPPVKGGLDVASGGATASSAGQPVTVQARGVWEAALVMFQSFETPSSKGGESWNKTNCERMLKKLEEVNKAQSGRFADAIYLVGTVSQRCGDRRAATEAFESALRIDPKLCKPRVALGLDRYQAGDIAGAEQLFRLALKNDAQCAEAYLDLAIIEQGREGGRQEALSNLRRSLAIRSDYLPVFNQMALLYLDEARGQETRERLDLAEIVCRQAQLVEGNYAPIYNTWGLIAVEKGDIIMALRMFERAASLDPNLFEAYVNFGQVAATFRGYEDAKKAFGRAVQLRPKDYDAHIGLGMALRGVRDFAAAKSEYETAKSLNPERPEAYFNLGVLYQDYMSGSIEDLIAAKELFGVFLAKASSRGTAQTAVEDVRRSCQVATDAGKKGRHRRSDCRPGRLQNLGTAIQALKEAAAAQRR